jgi:hypothetical protein
VNYVIDTHALIWYFTGSEKLKRQAKEAIDDRISRGGKLLVPTIVLPLSESNRNLMEVRLWARLLQHRFCWP